MHLSQGETHCPTALETCTRGCLMEIEVQRLLLGGGGGGCGRRMEGGRGEARVRSWVEKNPKNEREKRLETGAVVQGMRRK